MKTVPKQSEREQLRNELFANKTLLENVRDIVARNNTGYTYAELENGDFPEDDLDAKEELASVDKTVNLLLHLYGHHLEAAKREAQIAENQMYLDRINNFKPKPGQLTSANFGSASGAFETASWKHAFEDRIAHLSPIKQEEQAQASKKESEEES